MPSPINIKMYLGVLPLYCEADAALGEAVVLFPAAFTVLTVAVAATARAASIAAVFLKFIINLSFHFRTADVVRCLD